MELSIIFNFYLMTLTNAALEIHVTHCISNSLQCPGVEHWATTTLIKSKESGIFFLLVYQETTSGTKQYIREEKGFF